MNHLFAYDEAVCKHYKVLAGIDEAGRGPLAGPVVAAAVILKRRIFIPGVKDSKMISENVREKLFFDILAESHAVGVGIIEASTIDKINILNATKEAMKKAVGDLTYQPDILLIDALTIPGLTIAQKPLKKGESISASIAAASIVAKVSRDRFMKMHHKEFPYYNFKQHKGYPTKEHFENIRRYGPCRIHRKTFKGVL